MSITESNLSTAIVVAVAVALVTVPATAIAGHNSVGQHVFVHEADEVTAGADVQNAGELQPDVLDDEDFNITFHDNLAEGQTPIPPRLDPEDQKGLRYDGENCQKWSDFDGDFGAYKAALEDGTACYVGFMDFQFEYEFSELLLVSECPCDLLYPANPAQDDKYCTGEEDTRNRSISAPGPAGPTVENATDGNFVDGDNAADEALTSASRRDDSECGFGQDNSYLPGGVYVDTDRIETATSAAHAAGGTSDGSGVLSLPLSMVPYLYLFGQPHPDTPEEDRSHFEAGSGPFGPNAAELGNPLADLTGACGDRTKDCRILSPQDILNYDENFPSGESVDARVCVFFPQYTFGVPTDTDGNIERGADACGNTGERFDDFIGSTSFGGFGTGAPTWLTNLPGWHIALGFLTGVGDDGVDDFVDDYQDDEKGFREGALAYAAVNPVVPKRQDTLRCVVPNILADGDSSKLPTGFTDPGVYGTYQADAIDTDVYPVVMRDQLVTVRDETHDDLRPTIAAVQAVAEPATSAASDPSGAAFDTVDAVDAAVPDPVDFTEDPDPEPHAEYNPGDYDGTNAEPVNQKPFTDTVPKGLQCNAAGELVFRQTDSQRGGGLQFDATIQKDLGAVLTSQQIKDPTLFPEGESSSDAGVWLSGLYTFEGVSRAVLDINNNSQFDDCGGANLAPDEDSCPWKSLWDAYNPSCENNDQDKCGQILEERGYNTSKGVGLHFVLKQTGPIVLAGLTTESEALADRNVVGDVGDPTGKTCVIGTSRGFLPKLDALVGDGNGELDTGEREQLCGDHTDDIAVVEDAFLDQSAVTPGTYDAAFSWAKVLPTPSTVQEEAKFGDTDELCVTGTWHVADLTDDEDIASDTLGNTADPGQENIQLTEGLHQFSDCDSFDTTGEPKQ